MENVTTGGQPTIQDIQKLAAEGYALIVNLRVPGEFDKFDEAEEAQKVGLGYINIPVTGMGDLTLENATKLHEALQNAPGKVLVHCTIGMRAGGLLSVEEYIFENLSKAEALELAAKAHDDHLKFSVETAIETIETAK